MTPLCLDLNAHTLQIYSHTCTKVFIIFFKRRIDRFRQKKDSYEFSFSDLFKFDQHSVGLQQHYFYTPRLTMICMNIDELLIRFEIQ